jgi:hypothetical protein
VTQRAERSAVYRPQAASAAARAASEEHERPMNLENPNFEGGK